MLAELQVPEQTQEEFAHLRARAENILNLGGNFRVNAMLGRLATFQGANSDMEGIASLLLNKPPKEWVDADLDQATIELASLAQEILRIESYARVKGRSDKRQAMAVFVGIDGRPTPVFGEFDVSEQERPRVEQLVGAINVALATSRPADVHIVLAALAEVSTGYLTGRALSGISRTLPFQVRTGEVVNERHVLGLSGGRDSAALAVFMRQRYPALQLGTSSLILERNFRKSTSS